MLMDLFERRLTSEWADELEMSQSVHREEETFKLNKNYYFSVQKLNLKLYLYI